MLEFLRFLSPHPAGPSGLVGPQRIAFLIVRSVEATGPVLLDPLDQCIKHWEIAHNNGDEGFPDGPLSRLRCAARPSLPPSQPLCSCHHASSTVFYRKDENTSEDTSGRDQKTPREHDGQHPLLLGCEPRLPNHLQIQLVGRL